MYQVIPDEQIAAMITEAKPLPATWLQRLASLKPSTGNYESEVEITGSEGTRYRIVVRRNRTYANNFYIILMADLHGQTDFRILRYDGNSHSHVNRIERNRFDFKFHIHQATERYQIKTFGEVPDGFAYETSRYHDIGTAWSCFASDGNLKFPTAGASKSLPRIFTQV